MTSPVQALVDFYAATGLGNRAGLFPLEIRSVYLALTADEQEELARESIAQIVRGKRRFEQALCCLACFRPGSLAPVHQMLLERQILYPGVIFHGAKSDISRQLVALCEDGDCRNHTLLALAWIGDETAQSAFSNWRADPPSWASKLFTPPHRYAEEAGWELTSEGKRCDLFHPVAFPLVPPAGALGAKDAVKVGVPAEETCGWCNRKMVGLFDFQAIESVVSGQGAGRVRIVTCHVCTCFGFVFMEHGSVGEAAWHRLNKKPSYLPPESSEWESFPETPLAMDTEPRHFMEAAVWMLPVAFSQVGGLPTWIQDAEYPTCPDCSQKMPFIGQISNEDFVKYGEGIYYAFRCPKCNVTATCYQQT